MSSPSYHTGFWVNWSSGRVLGATVTVPKSQGGYLISFLTLVVSFSGSHLWKLICYAIHQSYSTRAETDGLHQQMQSILTAGLTDIGMILQFSKITWAWKGKTSKVWRRGLLLFGVSVLHFAAVSIAGLFASRVADSQDHVLIQASGDCGWYNEALLTQLNLGANFSSSDLTAFDSLALATRLGIYDAQQYAKTCYAWVDGYVPDNTSAVCSRYVAPYLSATVNSSAGCPFAAEACSTPAIAFDSGWIDSNDHLGVNAPEQDRVKVRLTTECAVIPMEQRYTHGWQKYPSFPGVLAKEYVLGASPYITADESNVTFYVLSNGTLNADGPYAPVVAMKYAGNTDESTFEPIDDFVIDNADLTIFGIDRNVAYTQKINDPLFEATVELPFFLSDSNVSLWISNTSMSGLGCVKRYQFCNQGTCTDPSGLFQLSDQNGTAPPQLHLNSVQTATFAAIWRALYSAQPYILTLILNGDLFRARERIPAATVGAAIATNLTVPEIPSILYYYSSALSDNQWQVETENLQNLVLAWIQQSMVDHAAPANYLLRPGVLTKQYLLHSTDAGELDICAQQKVRNPDFSSFNVFGLSFIVVVGSIIIILSYTVPPLVKRSQVRSGSAEALYRRDDWDQRDVLHLLRETLESRHPGTWTGAEDSIPTTIGVGQKMMWPAPKEAGHELPREEAPAAKETVVLEK